MDLLGYEMRQHWSRAAAFIRYAREGGGRCLVHCAAGINRRRAAIAAAGVQP